MILDEYFPSFHVEHLFQIRCFRSMYDHHWDGDYLFPGESHDFWEFFCVLEGTAEVVQDGKINLLLPGDFVCIPPMVFHSSRSVGISCHSLNFSFEQTGALPSRLAEGVFHLAAQETEELTRIFYRLFDVFSGNLSCPETVSEAAAALTAFLLRLSMHHAPFSRVTESRSGILYRKLVDYMQANVRENLSIQQIAEQNAVSLTTVKDLFRKYAGIGPKRYYADMRGIESLRLLEQGLEIDRIAERMNYSSPNYFSCAFKKQFGVPPGQYRKTLSAEGRNPQTVR